MKYEYLKYLKESNLTLKILNSDNSAFTLSFFHFVFIEKQNITLKHSLILQYLDDFLYDINQTYNNSFVKTAKEYLNDFANDKNAYLRKYHANEDETLYELTPHVHKALEFLEALDKKEFVGSRSKFNIIFELLEELEFETSLDDTERIAKLKAQKNDIDRQIKAIESKQDLRFDNSRIKEHFMQIEEIVRKLQYDFSEIEYNFRDLNMKAMEQIIIQDDTKGEVLGAIFDIEDSIKESDQGKSFFAFWQLLTDAKKSEKLSKLLENLYKIDAIEEFDKEKRMQDLKHSLLLSGAKISKVSGKLIEQLKRFLDDRVWLENRRVLELVKTIQKSAIDIKDEIPKQRNFMLLNGDRVKTEMVFEKSLYMIKEQKLLKQELNESVTEINLDSFYDIFFVDEAILQKNINEILLYKSQCSLHDIAQKYGIKKGVAELVGYISIAKNSENVMIYDTKYEIIEVTNSDGEKKMIKLPKIIFVK